MNYLRYASILTVLLFAQVMTAATISPSNAGITLDAGTMGKFTVEYPQLCGKDQKPNHKLIEKTANGGKAVLKYEGGGEIDVDVKPTGEVLLTFSKIPADVSQFSGTMMISFTLANGGVWKVDAQAEQPFPAEKPAKPHLFQGHARKITIKGYDGRSFSLGLPEYSYLQLTDNREWGWKIFALRFNVPFNPDVKTQKLLLTAGEAQNSEVKATAQVDSFGQNTRVEYPDKVKSLAELKADAETEKAYYAGFNPPKLDAFGGLPGSGEKLGLKKTGFFHVEKINECWYLVNPAGNAFFHLAIGCFQPASATYVAGREQIYEWLPPKSGEFASAWLKQDPNSVDFHVVNQIRKYGKTEDHTQWLERFIYRVRQFGFNSGGPFTGNMDQQPADASFPYVSGLPLNQWDAGITRIPGIRETWDPFDAKVCANIEKDYSRLEKNKNNPLIIGYFIINEPLYEDIPKVIPTLGGKWACKRELVANLEKKYGEIAAFNQAWNMKAKSFAELNDQGLPVTTRSAAEDMQAFTEHFLDTLMNVVCTTARKYDPNHMIIGNRLQSGTINNQALCRIFGKYLDVMSFNYYTYYLDKDFLKRIYSWTGRPMFLSEFYWNSPSDTGLPGGVKDIGSQVERGLAYRNYVEQAAATGYIVGIEWFTLIDQPLTGNWFSKYSGENGNTGLFSVVDRPYKAMIAEMIKTNYNIYKVMAGEQQPFVYDDPRFNQVAAGKKMLKIAHATGPIKIDGGTANWPGLPAETISSKRLVEGNNAGGVEASFKLCWDEKYLYVLVNVTDPTPMQNNNAPDHIWSGDAVELFIGAEKPDEGGSLLFTDRQILLSAALKDGHGQSFINHAPSQAECPMAVVPHGDGKGYTLEAAIPFSALNLNPKDGVKFRFDLSVDDSEDGHRRLRQLAWNGTNRNSGDRTAWGQAILTP